MGHICVAGAYFWARAGVWCYCLENSSGKSGEIHCGLIRYTSDCFICRKYLSHVIVISDCGVMRLFITDSFPPNLRRSNALTNEHKEEKAPRGLDHLRGRGG